MRGILAAVRRPEYTGERRCWQCTVVNLVLLGVGVAFVSLLSPVASVALATLGGMVIWLRGYLVPYTPRFAPRLVAYLPGQFGHDEPGAKAASLGGDGEIDGDAVVAALVEAGVLVVEAGGESLVLDEGFESQWRAEMRVLREASDEELAEAVVAVAPDMATAEPYEGRDDTWIVLSDGSGEITGETWLSRPVAVAEAAVVRALEAAVEAGDKALFVAAARPLRTFLVACPLCDGPVVETTTAACCGTGPDPMANPTRDVLACADCDSRVYTFEREPLASEN